MVSTSMINKVYLSGMVVGAVKDVGEDGQPNHAVFDLCVPHKTREGVEKRELYRINAWHGCARFCLSALENGMVVALQGYLAQRMLYVAGRSVVTTEVSANLITAPRRAEPAAGEAVRRDIEAEMDDLDAETQAQRDCDGE